MITTLLIGSALIAVAGTGASYSAEQKILRAHGAAAADLRAPSAEVARIRAERTARMRAEKKLQAALSALGPLGSKIAPKKVEELLAAAKIVDEQFGSDGSVELQLELSTEGLALRSPRSR
jgi:hypothetical protein